MTLIISLLTTGNFAVIQNSQHFRHIVTDNQLKTNHQ